MLGTRGTKTPMFGNVSYETEKTGERHPPVPPPRWRGAHYLCAWRRVCGWACCALPAGCALPAECPALEADDPSQPNRNWLMTDPRSRALAYAEATRDLDTAPLRARFLAALAEPAGGGPLRILDVGPGSGRDARAFRQLGLAVEGIDPSAELAHIASVFAGIPVSVCRVQDLGAAHRFDGIWACASLLHVPWGELPATFDRLAHALTPGGVLYASFKWAPDEAAVLERTADGRHFTDLRPAGLRALLAMRPVPSPTLREVQLWQTPDVRPERARAGEAWLNVLLRREA